MTAGGGRARGVTGHDRIVLSEGWELASMSPGGGGLARPDLAGLTWRSARAPSTAAAVLREAGAWSLDAPPRRFDDADWLWRARVVGGGSRAGEETVLCLDGLATVADVWWNGAHVLTSENMFVAHEVAVTVTGDDEILIRCRALDSLLGARRPRPRWRAPMIEHQQLRWFRTTLLGRTPGWSPPAAAVGPWREVRVERRRGVTVEGIRLAPSLAAGAGVLAVSGFVRALEGAVRGLEVVVERGESAQRAPLTCDGERFQGTVKIDRPELWWPHTHGEPACYRVRLCIHRDEGTSEVELGRVGFRDVAVDTTGGEFAVTVNGVRVFCRGACWTPLDPVSLQSGRAEYDDAIAQAVDCGMNMLRVGGTMVYESDDFYDACDTQGVLVWQDFMFANMDYPEDDPGFVASVTTEARQILARLQGRPSIAVLCGNSEVEQQAAMWGASRERWSPRLFHETLPALVREVCPGVTYWPSSAHGGAFPHEARTGTTSYYGVGAYLRPLDDARRSEVRFASECLAFANVPPLGALPGGPTVKVHHPAWKGRTPRDLGAGWDFDDVRDHYVELLYGVDVRTTRYADHDRYLALSQVAPGEVMAATFAEWRRARSTCRGALVWFLRDLWTSAGWGLVDSSGAPKPVWYYVRRALQPVAISISDEGGDGLWLHVVNDAATPLAAEIELVLWRAGETRVAAGTRSITLGPHGAAEWPAAGSFDGFLDLSYAYRFGPPSHDLVVATLRAEGERIGDAWFFPRGLPATREPDVGLVAVARTLPDGDAELDVTTRRFAQSVSIEVDGFAPVDDYFHLPPGGGRTVRLRRRGAAAPARGVVRALNAEAAAKFSSS